MDLTTTNNNNNMEDDEDRSNNNNNNNNAVDGDQDVIEESEDEEGATTRIIGADGAKSNAISNGPDLDLQQLCVKYISRHFEHFSSLVARELPISICNEIIPELYAREKLDPINFDLLAPKLISLEFEQHRAALQQCIESGEPTYDFEAFYKKREESSGRSSKRPKNLLEDENALADDEQGNSNNNNQSNNTNATEDNNMEVDMDDQHTMPKKTKHAGEFRGGSNVSSSSSSDNNHHLNEADDQEQESANSSEDVYSDIEEEEEEEEEEDEAEESGEHSFDSIRGWVIQKELVRILLTKAKRAYKIRISSFGFDFDYIPQITQQLQLHHQQKQKQTSDSSTPTTSMRQQLIHPLKSKDGVGKRTRKAKLDLTKFAQMKSLSFDKCWAVKVQNIMFPSSLTSLNLSHCTLVGSNGSLAPLAGLKELKLLSLAHTHVSDSCIGTIAENLTNLSSLNIGYTDITRDGLRILLTSLVNLETLNISRLRVVPEIESLPLLTSLTVERLHSTPDFLLLKGLTNLTELSVAMGSTAVTNSSIDQVLAGMTNLTSLDLSECVFISDAATNRIQGLSKLTNLQLSFTDISVNMPQLITGLPALKKLAIYETPIRNRLMDNASISKLNEATKQLEDRGVEIIKNGSVDDEVRALASFVKQGDEFGSYGGGAVLERILRHLQGLALQPDDRKRITEKGGIDLVLATLRAFPHHSTLVEYACGVIQNMALDETNKAYIAKCGGTHTIINLARRHLNDVRIMRATFGSLRNLAILNVNKEIVEREGGIELITYGLRRHDTDEMFLEQACAVLWNLSVKGEATRAKIAQHRIVQLVIGVMKAFPASIQLLRMACGALGMLSANPEISQLIREEGGIMALFNIAKANQTDNTLIRSVCSALRNISVNDANRMYLCENNIIQEFVKMMETNVRNVSCVVSVCDLLFDLAVNVTIRKCIGECGGIEAILNALVTHDQDISVLESTLDALWNISDYEPNHARMLKSGGIQVIIKVLNKDENLKNYSMRRSLSGLVGNLGESDYCRGELIRGGALRRLISLVHDDNNDELDLQYLVSYALANLAGHEEEKQEIIESGTLNELARFVKRWPLDSEISFLFSSMEPLFGMLHCSAKPEVQQWTCWSLANLTRNVKYQELFYRQSGFTVVTDYLASNTGSSSNHDDLSTPIAANTRRMVLSCLLNIISNDTLREKMMQEHNEVARKLLTILRTSTVLQKDELGRSGRNKLIDLLSQALAQTQQQ